MLDDVHRGHREAGAVDEAGDVAVEGDVGEAELRGLDFLGVLFVEVAEGDDVRVTEERVVVEGDLRVEREELAFGGHEEGVDLDHGAILFPVELVEFGDERHALLKELTGEAEAEGDLAGLEGLQADGRVDVDLEDFLGVRVGDVFDFHAAFGRSDDHGLRGGAVEEDGEVVLVIAPVGALAEVRGFGEVDGLDLAAGLARLGGHERVAEHRLGVRDGLFLGGRELHAALEAVGEGALAAAARVDLGLHHDAARGVELGDGRVELADGRHRDAFRHRDAELLEELLGLVFVNVHERGRSGRVASGLSPSARRPSS